MDFTKRLTDFLRHCTLPVLLLTVLFCSTVYIYACGDMFIFAGLTLVSLLYFTLLLASLEFLRNLNKTWVTTVVTFLELAASLIIGTYLIETIHTDTAQWFFEPTKFPQVYVGNIISLLLMVGFVLGDALYYFTRVRFRPVYVFLICMCPFSLFAKSFTDIPVIFTILIITLFFLLVITNETRNTQFSGKNRYMAIAVFVAVITAGAAFMPKLEYAPYREEFDELITGVNMNIANQVDFNQFTESSSYSSAPDDEEKVLYTFIGDNPLYVKRQCFNSYNSQTTLWEYVGEALTGYNRYTDYIKWENPAVLAAEYGLNMEVSKKNTMISAVDDSIHAIYTPENIASIEFPFSSLSDYGTKYVYRTPFDEYFHAADANQWSSYSVTWYDFDIDVEFMLFYTDELAEKINGTNSKAYLKTKDEMRKLHDPLMTEQARRDCYRSDSGYEKVKNLVSEITRNCTNDYTKAQAIEQYFKSSEFYYDKEFTPADGSVENFLFNTKRGICSDYATAMTLMCREAGLYSRYVEGFLVQNIDSEGNFSVTAADGHAYVQVWLDGYGWTDFDPTSSNLYEGSDGTFLIVGIITVLIALAGVIIVFVLPVISELRFVSSAGRLRGKAQLKKLYPRINTLVHKELRLKQNVMTVNELKEAVYSQYGIDISETADDYEKTVYGDIECGNKNYITSYKELKKAIKQYKSAQNKKRR